VNAKPTATVTGTATICAGASTTVQASLTGTGPWNVTWSDSVTQSNVAASPVTRSVSPASTTTYTVTAVNDSKCTGTSSGSAVVTVNPIPAAPTAGNDGPVCEGGTLQLTASTVTGATYAWTGPNGYTSTQQNPVISGVTSSAAGVYSVRATVGGCASASATTTVVVKTRPATPVITAPASVGAYSPNRTASVPPHAGSTYAWNVTNGQITAGQGTNQVTFSSLDPGTLALSVVETDSSGCTSQQGSVLVTVLGPSDALPFYTVPACRLLDTRDPDGPDGGPILSPGPVRVFPAAATCGIPSTAKAISANVTITQPVASGYLTFFPGNATVPITSTINFRPGQTRANNAILPLSTDGLGTIGVLNGSSGTVHVIVDVSGYFE
jgi:hypothetical protein